MRPSTPSSSSCVDFPIPLPLPTPSTSESSASVSTSSSTNKQKPRKYKNKITNYVDKLEEEDVQFINEQLALFVYGCNIPFRVIESKLFKNFIVALRPAYKNKIPSRKLLSNALLNQCYNKCIEHSKPNIKKESVLIIDGWKNSSSNVKTVLTMIHCADGTQSFLNAWDLTLESETGERLSEIVQESIKLSKDIYDTTIFAIVSDNASPMIKMGGLVKHLIWHSTCSSHTANLLCKDVLDKKVIEQATSVLKEFKNPKYERMLLAKGSNCLVKLDGAPIVILC